MLTELEVNLDSSLGGVLYSAYNNIQQSFFLPVNSSFYEVARNGIQNTCLGEGD